MPVTDPSLVLAAAAAGSGLPGPPASSGSVLGSAGAARKAAVVLLVPGPGRGRRRKRGRIPAAPGLGCGHGAELGAGCSPESAGQCWSQPCFPNQLLLLLSPACSCPSPGVPVPGPTTARHNGRVNFRLLPCLAAAPCAVGTHLPVSLPPSVARLGAAAVPSKCARTEGLMLTASGNGCDFVLSLSGPFDHVPPISPCWRQPCWAD